MNLMAEQYVQQPSKGFTRSSALGGELAVPGMLGPVLLPVQSVQSEARAAMEPTGGSQASLFLMGFVCFAAQGIFAGVSLMQALLLPGMGVDDLALHLAYAPLAMPLQISCQLLAFAAFMGASDAAAAHQRSNVQHPHEGLRGCSYLAIWLYGGALLALALQLPIDLGLEMGLDERSDFLHQRLAAAGGDPRDFLSRPVNLTETPQLELESGSYLELRLSSGVLDFLYVLSVVRAALALLAWALLASERGSTRFALPPLSELPHNHL